MNKKNNLLLSLAIIMLITTLIGIRILDNGKSDKMGSVSQNNQYEYTQLTGAVATSSLINLGRTTLGSVIITEDQAGAVVLYDATSTAAITDGTYSTRIADFQDAQTEGVYTFDVGLTYGLMFQSVDGFSFAGDWTITYRTGW